MEFAQRSNVLLMNLWGRKWSPYPIPPPSWDCLDTFVFKIQDLLLPSGYSGVCTGFGHDMKSMDSINQNLDEIHSQKYDLGHLVKVLAVDNTEYSHFKLRRKTRDSGYSQQLRKAHRNAHQEV